jgi:hypothetical protein
MELTILQTSGLLVIILVAYGTASSYLRRNKSSKYYLIVARILAVAATALLVQWPMIYDSVFVEHFPDEATMPGPAFAALFFIILSSLLWATYALFRLTAVAVRKARS